jgi:transcriptional regulator with XRE-family HTH domain
MSVSSVGARRIAQRVREGLRRYGFSFATLAERIGVSKGKIQHWLDSDQPTPMHAADLKAIAAAYGIAVQRLYDPPGAPWPTPKRNPVAPKLKPRLPRIEPHEPGVRLFQKCAPCDMAEPCAAQVLPRVVAKTGPLYSRLDALHTEAQLTRSLIADMSALLKKAGF